MKRFESLFVATLCFIALALCPAVHAQTGTGNVQGVVTDASGAVIPNAKLSLTHMATAREFETRTNEIGFFLFPSAQHGSYKLAVQAEGMQRWEGELLLQAGQTAVLEPVLKVGAITTEVTVAGNVTPLVTTTSATLSNVVERKRIEQLPLNGRFVQSLVLQTTPGLEGFSGAPRVFGLRANAMEFLQDGAVLTNRDNGEISGRPPGLDTIEEFRVEANNSSAKFNRPATTILTTKSGTNQIHGALFETHRNSAFGVARRREDFYDKPPHLVRNEFGASVGGPIHLPENIFSPLSYDGRNRTFFFFAYEAFRNLSSFTASTTMPTLAMRQGDFSGLVDGSGRRIMLYDPNTTDPKTGQRQPFPNNQIPLNRISPLAKYFYSVTPAPTHPEINPLVAANWFGLGVSNRLDHTETVRIDHRISERDQFFARYTHGSRFTKALSGPAPMLDEAGNVTFRPVRDENGVASWAHNFSPTFFSETVVSVSHEDLSIFVGTDNLNHADRLGLPNPFRQTGFPYFDTTGFGMEYLYPDNKRNFVTRILVVDENLTKVIGKHTLQFGGRFRHERLNTLPDQQQPQGYHNFASLATALYDPTSGSSYSATPLTGHNAANLFLGHIGFYSAQFTRKWYFLNGREYALYFQDDFKVTPKLTLNLGVRWEFYPAYRERDNFLTGFDVKSLSVVNGLSPEKMYELGLTTPAIVKTFTDIGVKFTTPREAGLPEGFIYSNPHDFHPRAGFAYRLGSAARAMVVRGGYASYGFPIPLRTFNARMRSNAPTNRLFFRDINDASQSPDGLPNYGLRSVQTIIAGVNSRDVVDLNNPELVGRGTFRTSFFNPRQPTTRAHEWNLTLEKEIFDNTVVRAGYVGTHGSNLEQFYSLNEPAGDYVWFVNTGQRLPTGTFSRVARRQFSTAPYGTVEEYRKSGWSNYNGFQFEIQRRFAKGIGFQAFYVLSNAFRAAGNGFADDFLNEKQVYLNGAVSDDLEARNRFLNYRRDIEIPKHRLHWNWIVDLPFGRGQRFARNANGFLDHLIGGWQVAGFGTVRSNYWTLPTSNWGELGKVEIYGKKYPIKDCRSGTCFDGYLYSNGYIPSNRINSTDAQGRPNGVMGVPSIYQPAHKPVIPWGTTTPQANMPAGTNLASFWDTNTVWVRLNDGTIQRTTLNTNLHPWRNQFIPGPLSWGLDASLFKHTRITERVSLRFNADFFNVLNDPGLRQPDPFSGIITNRFSAKEPRQLQLTLRLIW